MSEGPFIPRGTLLLSAPHMLDPSFMHAVVLMIDHRKDGAMGVVINRRAETRISDLLKEHESLGSCEEFVWSGGPVGLDSLQILHRLGDQRGPEIGGLPVGPREHGVHLGAELDALGERLAQGAPDDDPWANRLRFIVGYAGWGSGQLEEEINERSWLPLEMNGEVLFSRVPGEATWRLAMSQLRGDGASLLHLPPDPRWN